MAEIVTNGIRDAIMAGELAPNARIKQAEVAERFGVSRSPVREAFRELASEGFLELEQDVGARVRPLDPEEVIELYLAREAIEPIMIAETTRRITPEQFDNVRRLNELSEQFAAKGDITGYLTADRDMHAALLDASCMPLLIELTRGLWQRTQRFRFDYTTAGRLERSVLEHQLILSAIDRQQPEEAADYYRIHTRRTRLTLVDAGPGADSADGLDAPQQDGVPKT
jgi:GntR family transcriptional regulator, rspAB operon transcriptional repressor